MTSYRDFHKRSIEDRDGFWGEQAELIHWNKKPTQTYDFSKPPFVKWFVGGETNLCYNAVDRWLPQQADKVFSSASLLPCGDSPGAVARIWLSEVSYRRHVNVEDSPPAGFQKIRTRSRSGSRRNRLRQPAPRR